MAHRFITSVRTAWAQAIVDAAGAASVWEHYSGALPTALSDAPAGTLLASHTCGSVMGVAAAGVLTLSTGGYTNTPGSNVSGTPTFARLRSAGGTVVWDVPYGSGPYAIQNTGAVVAGSPYAFGTSTLTMPNA